MEPIALEFAATETYRPEIIRRSLESFRANLGGVDWDRSRCCVNLDPIPRNAVNPARLTAIVDAIAGVFPTFSLADVHFARKPNFARAVKWAWTAPTGCFGDRFFYLQMDWILTRRVSIADLVALLDRDDGRIAVNLRAHRANMRERLCLSPVLIRRSTARELADAMTDADGPEAQLRPPSFRRGGRSLAVGLQSLHWPADRVVEDIGRDWMDREGFVKDGGSNFTRWKKPLREEVSVA